MKRINKLSRKFDNFFPKFRKWKKLRKILFFWKISKKFSKFFFIFFKLAKTPAKKFFFENFFSHKFSKYLEKKREINFQKFFFQIATIADRRRLLLSTAESVYLGIKKISNLCSSLLWYASRKTPYFHRKYDFFK